jgi:hypothetical protein
MKIPHSGGQGDVSRGARAPSRNTGGPFTAEPSGELSPLPGEGGQHTPARVCAARRAERGMVLVTTLVIACLVGIVVGAVMIVVQQQNSFVARSRTWCSEIPIAEAGIEEAMTHLNSLPSDLASSGWTLSGGYFVKTREIGDGYYSVSISPDTQPTITAIGFGRIPMQTKYTQRTVQVTTTRATSGGYGVVAKGVIKIAGTNAYIDSFDSSDTAASSNGLYTVSRRLDDVKVGSISTNALAITTGSGYIYGQVATGTGGTVSGTIGDGNWIANSANADLVQPGHVSDDFTMSIPDVTAPYTSGASVPIAVAGVRTLISSTNYMYSGDFSIPSGSSLIVAGKARLYVTGRFITSGSGIIQILPGGSLELYIGGALGSISGGGVVNNTQSAANCAIYGLPACAQLTYSGTAAYIGQVYTPQAAFTLSGSAGASGSITAKTISITGGASIHYDKALSRRTAPYEIGTWAELPW